MWPRVYLLYQQSSSLVTEWSRSFNPEYKLVINRQDRVSSCLNSWVHSMWSTRNYLLMWIIRKEACLKNKLTVEYWLELPSVNDSNAVKHQVEFGYSMTWDSFQDNLFTWHKITSAYDITIELYHTKIRLCYLNGSWGFVHLPTPILITRLRGEQHESNINSQTTPSIMQYRFNVTSHWAMNLQVGAYEQATLTHI